MLAARPQNLYSISESFDMSRQAISLHVRILAECGLITIRQLGRERFCSIEPQKLAEVAYWIEPFRELWEHHLDRLGVVLKNMEKRRKKHKK
jgi:DNA-binding transcriptional ArsR family regulator